MAGETENPVSPDTGAGGGVESSARAAEFEGQHAVHAVGMHAVRNLGQGFGPAHNAQRGTVQHEMTG